MMLSVFLRWRSDMSPEFCSSILRILLLSVFGAVLAFPAVGAEIAQVPRIRSQYPRAAAPPAKPEEQCPEQQAWLVQQRVIFLTGEVNAELAELVVAQLLELDGQDPGKEIYLYINSPGGEIAPGLAIYDVMQALRSPVATVGMGEASSMGSFLLAAGSKGRRFAMPNARIMIHQPRWGAYGPASDIAIAAKEILYYKTKLNQLLASMTGQPLSRIQADTDRDFFMSAQEAKAYGLVDQVVSRPPSATTSQGE